MALALADTCQARNATIECNGRTPEQVAFARSLLWMSTALNDDDDLHLSALDAEGEAFRSTLLRATACTAWHDLDLKGKDKQALL
eukprot:8195357-Heterocapsa_arctica.AAC.1